MSGLFTNTTLSASALNDAINGYTINAQTGTTYTFVLLDAGKMVTASNASAQTYTVPTNASVAYGTGTVINVLNLGAGLVTLSPAGGVTLNGATTISQYASVALTKTGTDTWVGVAGGLPKASVSGTTGAPTIDSATRPGKTIYKFAGDGSITFSTVGSIEVMLCGAGGSSGNDGAGGAGGLIYTTAYYVPATGTYTVKIGAAGSAIAANVSATDIAYNGGNTYFGGIASGGGGHGGDISGAGAAGGSGGGSARDTATNPAASFGSQGNVGGQGHAASVSGGAGGGSAAAGADGSAANGTGGAGTSISITGAAAYYCAGGNTAKGTPSTAAGQTAYNTNGAANSGSGAGGNRKLGGSGYVVIVVG